MRTALLTLAAIGALSACAVAAAPSPVQRQPAVQAQAVVAPPIEPQVAPASHASGPGVWCDIRITPTRNGARFEPIAESRGFAAGQYHFVLTRIDASGTSDVEQSGDYDLSPGGLVVLGSSELSFDRRTRFRARLILEDEYGVVCQEEARS